MLHIRAQIQIQIQSQIQTRIVIHFSHNSLVVAMWVSHVAKVLAAMALIKLTKRRCRDFVGWGSFGKCRPRRL